MQSQSLRASKRALRKEIQATLKDLSPKNIQEQYIKSLAEGITSHIIASQWFIRCKIASCYLSMPTGEVDTGPLVSEILRAGKTLYAPRVHQGLLGQSHSMDLLRVHDEEDLHTFPSGKWGIREPSEDWRGTKRANAMDDAFEGLDLILVPGVAFDHSLARLGHGKGYYDRYITTYSAKRPKPLLVALALREQIVQGGVPMDAHDWKMDMLVSPDGIYTNPASDSIRSFIDTKIV